MKAHKGDVRVQKHGCCVLLIILANNDYDNVTAIVAAGCIPAVLAAMKAHMGDEGVQHHGCMTLIILADNAYNATAIVAAVAVQAAMAAHAGPCPGCTTATHCDTHFY